MVRRRLARTSSSRNLGLPVTQHALGSWVVIKNPNSKSLVPNPKTKIAATQKPIPIIKPQIPILNAAVPKPKRNLRFYEI